MNLRKKDELKEVLKEPIESVQDYKERIKIIEKFFNRQNNTNFKTFYRGDRKDSEVTAKLFKDNNIEQEKCCFEQWQKNCKDNDKKYCNCQNEIMCLAAMQHEEKTQTRLLDFTKDPLVALRFACGRENSNAEKKVTFFYTNYLNENETFEKSQWFMKLVKCDDLSGFSKDERNFLKEDYFIEVPLEFEKIKRQKGCFLFMGNTKEINKRKFFAKKVGHSLCPHIGRGRQYEGYVGELTIASEYVENIRNELDKNSKYNSDYLFCKEKQNEKTN